MPSPSRLPGNVTSHIDRRPRGRGTQGGPRAGSVRLPPNSLACRRTKTPLLNSYKLHFNSNLFPSRYEQSSEKTTTLPSDCSVRWLFPTHPSVCVRSALFTDLHNDLRPQRGIQGGRNGSQRLQIQGGLPCQGNRTVPHRPAAPASSRPDAPRHCHHWPHTYQWHSSHSPFSPRAIGLSNRSAQRPETPTAGGIKRAGMRKGLVICGGLQAPRLSTVCSPHPLHQVLHSHFQVLL